MDHLIDDDKYDSLITTTVIYVKQQTSNMCVRQVNAYIQRSKLQNAIQFPLEDYILSLQINVYVGFPVDVSNDTSGT